MVGGLEPGDSAAQGFAGALHINLRVCEPLQAILGALLGFLGAFDVDILGAFGALDQDDGAIRQNFGEAPIDAEEVLHPSPRVIKFAGHEFRSARERGRAAHRDIRPCRAWSEQ